MAEAITTGPSTPSILTLPNELLGKICMETVREYLQLRCLGSSTNFEWPNNPSLLYEAFHGNYHHTEPFYGWLSTTQVCQRWRQAALDTPRLWVNIKLTSPDCVSTCLRRSGQAPLLIFAPPARFSHDESLGHLDLVASLRENIYEMVQMVWLELHRVQQLEIPMTGELLARLDYISRLASNAPQLQELSMLCLNEPKYFQLVPVLSHTVFRRVKTLALHGPLACKYLPMLRLRSTVINLTLDFTRQPIYLPELLPILSGLPLLLSLSVTGVAPDPLDVTIRTLQRPASPMVSLLNLQSLVLRACESNQCVANADLLRHLILPPHTTISFDASSINFGYHFPIFAFQVLSETVRRRPSSTSGSIANPFLSCKITGINAIRTELIHVRLCTTSIPSEEGLSSGDVDIRFDRGPGSRRYRCQYIMFIMFMGSAFPLASVQHIHLDMRRFEDPYISFSALFNACTAVQELHLESELLMRQFFEWILESMQRRHGEDRLKIPVPHLGTLTLGNANWCHHPPTRFIEDQVLCFPTHGTEPLSEVLLKSIEQWSAAVGRPLDALVLRDPDYLYNPDVEDMQSSRFVRNFIHENKGFNLDNLWIPVPACGLCVECGFDY